jgi:large subunit ribosomal protein L28
MRGKGAFPTHNLSKNRQLRERFPLQSQNLSDNILMLFFRTCNYSARLRKRVPDPSTIDGVLNNYLNLEGLGGVKMAKCDICGRGAFFGNQVSHSHRRSNKVWHANVQRIAVKTAGGSKKIHVCTRCMRSGKVERA